MLTRFWCSPVGLILRHASDTFGSVGVPFSQASIMASCCHGDSPLPGTQYAMMRRRMPSGVIPAPPTRRSRSAAILSAEWVLREDVSVVPHSPLSFAVIPMDSAYARYVYEVDPSFSKLFWHPPCWHHVCITFCSWVIRYSLWGLMLASTPGSLWCTFALGKTSQLKTAELFTPFYFYWYYTL